MNPEPMCPVGRSGAVSLLLSQLPYTGTKDSILGSSWADQQDPHMVSGKINFSRLEPW